MNRYLEYEKCTGCHACYTACPQKAINMLPNSEGFLYPHIDNNKCIECKKCNNVCPIITPVKGNEYKKVALIAKSVNDSIRLTSSSGGIFSLLSEYVLSQGGVVIGASFSDDFYYVHHTIIESYDDIECLKGSKYLQSDVGDIYIKVKRILNENRIVLFSGTNCQIAALKNYLGKNYNNLFLIDVVCHGVPSPKLWSIYLKSLEKKHKARSSYVNFRIKKIKWKSTGIRKEYGSNIYYKELKDDKYLNMFQKNLSLRYSCYNCIYKSKTGISDLSLGDLWGANSVAKNFNDDKGISFVYVHSNKGKNLINSIKDLIELQEIDINDVLKNNKNVVYNSPMPDERKYFYYDLDNLSFDKFIKKYNHESTKIRVWNILNKFGIIKLRNIIMRNEKKICEIDKNLEYGLLVVFRKK